MNTKYLTTLKTIIEAGSFQKAATILNYTQSTITFHVQQLEQEMGFKLFEKIGRRMVLTDAGNAVIPHMETILQATEQINDYGKDISEIGGTLRIAMPDILLIYEMQPILKAFREYAPNVQLIIKSLTCHSIREDVIAGGVDVGIHCDIGGYPGNVMNEKLAEYPACLVASPSLESVKRDFVTPHQRKHVNLISCDPNSVYQKRFMDYLTDKDIVLNGYMEMWSIEAAKRSVISNLGITYLPIFTIDEELKRGDVIPIKTDLDNTMVEVVCTYHKNKWISAPMELFIRLLKEQFESQR